MDSFFDQSARSTARQLGASDVHLKPGLAPILRIDGELRTLRGPTCRRCRASSSTAWRCRCSTTAAATSLERTG